MQNTTARLLLIIAVSIVVKGELANKTINYDADIKTYQFKLEVQVNKKGRPDEGTSLTPVFKKRVPNQIGCDCRWYIKANWKKVLAAAKVTTWVKKLPKVGNSWIFFFFWNFYYANLFSDQMVWRRVMFCQSFIIVFFFQAVLCYFYHKKDCLL